MNARDTQQSLFPELRPARPVGHVVPSVIAGDNADLMAAVAPLYLTGSVLDITYGRGLWWRRYKPDQFQGHDLATDGTDFRQLPHPDRSWDTVCFDPPYVPSDRAQGTTRQAFRARYGLTEPRNQLELEAMVHAGLKEAARVARTYLLVKCMDYTSNSRFVLMSHAVIGWALELGLHPHDEIVLHAGAGPGSGPQGRQVRARRHHSKLLVFSHVQIRPGRLA